MSRYIPKAVRKAVRKRDKNKCVYCGYRYWNRIMSKLREISGEQYQKLEYGHVIPYSKGGNNCQENIQMECFKCNRRKSDSVKQLSLLKRIIRDEAKGCRGRCNHSIS